MFLKFSLNCKHIYKCKSRCERFLCDNKKNFSFYIFSLFLNVVKF
nr:MAG TPA: hypothetical protein [Caudoviricetes sp.]